MHAVVFAFLLLTKKRENRSIPVLQPVRAHENSGIWIRLCIYTHVNIVTYCFTLYTRVCCCFLNRKKLNIMDGTYKEKYIEK